MEAGIQPESPLREGHVQFQPRRGITLRTVGVGLAVAGCSLGLLLSGIADRFNASWGVIFVLVVFVPLMLFHLSRQLSGDGLGGLLVDDEGIVDQQGFLGRVPWEEIRGIRPVDQSFFGIPIDRQGIGLEVTQELRQRKPAWKVPRFRGRSGPLLLPTNNLEGSRDEILRVLQDRFEQYELRSIAEGKELESGS
jgi:hypothetical protein